MADSEVFFPSQYVGRHNDHGSLPVKATTKYPKGTMVARDGNGRAARPATGLQIHGISEGDFDNTASGPNGDKGNDAFNVELSIGVGVFDYSGTAPKAEEVVYAVDNHTVSTDSSGGTRGIAGVCTEAGASGKVAVYIDPVLNGALKNGTGTVQIATLTINDEDLTDADGSQSFNLGSALPAGAVILAHAFNVTEAFTDGAAGAFTLSVGISGALTAVANGASLASIARLWGPEGARAQGRYPSAQLLATVNANVNVVNATAGQVVVEVFYVVL